MKPPQIIVEMRNGERRMVSTINAVNGLLGIGPVRRDVHVPRKYWVWQHKVNKGKGTSVMYHRGCFTMPEGRDLNV